MYVVKTAQDFGKREEKRVKQCPLVHRFKLFSFSSKIQLKKFCFSVRTSVNQWEGEDKKDAYLSIQRRWSSVRRPGADCWWPVNKKELSTLCECVCSLFRSPNSIWWGKFTSGDSDADADGDARWGRWAVLAEIQLSNLICWVWTPHFIKRPLQRATTRCVVATLTMKHTLAHRFIGRPPRFAAAS